MTNIELFVSVQVWDRDGNVVQSLREPSRSLVKPFLAILLAQMIATAGSNPNLSGTHNDTGGTARTLHGAIGTNQLAYGAVGAVNDDTLGIVIGTGTTAVDITDTALATKIAEGTGSGQMTHQAQTYDGDITISDPDATFETNRDFNNNSGAQITVAETGVYCLAQAAGSARKFCMVRDVPTSVDVPDGGGCNVKYTFKISE